MTFKETIAADLDIFTDITEFAELIEIDGVELPAQVVPSTAEKSQRLQEQFAGLYGDFVTIYFQSAEYTSVRGQLPVKGNWALIGNKRFDVIETHEQLGICKVIAAAYRQPTPRLGDYRRN